MRRKLSIIVVAATTILVPMFAMAGNQEVAEQIAQNLKHSGKLSNFRIGVRFEDGTVIVKGRVATQEQMNTALRLVFKTSGVSRVINEMTIGESETSTAAVKNSSMYSAQRIAGSDTLSPVQQVVAMEPDTLPRQHLENNAPRPISGQMPTPTAMSQVNEPVEASKTSGQMAIPVVMIQAMPVQNSGVPGAPRPMYSAGTQGGVAPVRYDQPSMPNYAWPSYAAYPNYAAVTYPRQYSPTAWPYIGPFYPYPQVPLGWRKVTMEWKDGWWFLDFKDEPACCWR
ncbi:MAG: BON domain-containing protein [Thermoguttaceae bacterium]|jgi:hypothetical protein